jgi:hypothetical protein
MKTMAEPNAIFCEIHAPRSSHAAALAEIAVECAADVGQPLEAQALVVGRDCTEATLILHLPAELAVAQHRVWCLACRLACFCPEARVSVLIRGEKAFAPTPVHAPPRRRTA